MFQVCGAISREKKISIMISNVTGGFFLKVKKEKKYIDWPPPPPSLNGLIQFLNMVFEHEIYEYKKRRNNNHEATTYRH